MLDVYRSYSPIDVVFQSGFGVGRQDSKPVGIVVSLKKKKDYCHGIVTCSGG